MRVAGIVRPAIPHALILRGLVEKRLPHVARDLGLQQRHELHLRSIHVPPGEIRVLAIPQKLECSAGRYLLTANNSGVAMMFSAAIADRFEVNSFNSEAGIVEVGCRAQLPALPSVITFRQNGNDRELVAVEFVPSFYKLP